MIKMLFKHKIFFYVECKIGGHKNKTLNSSAVFNPSSFPPFLIYILELQHSLNKGEVPAASGHLSYLKPQPLLLWLSNIFPFPLLFEIITVTREPSFIVLLNLQDKKIAEQRISTQISAFQVTYKKLCILFIPLILF